VKNDQHITSVEELIASTESLTRDSCDYILFRGQPNNKPLLPKVARTDPNKDTTELELKMVKEFRRRLARERDISTMDAWDILVYAQHHGLSTRLLDWTTNPLFALWFACSDYRSPSDGYIFLLTAKEEALLDTSVEKDPLKIKKTYVVKPNINTSRIRAQSGWFTVHRFSKKEKQFVDLHQNTSVKGKILMKGIPQNKKLDILKTLDKLGVNEESVYPGPEGTAKHINWLHRDDF
jgi:FRG domain